MRLFIFYFHFTFVFFSTDNSKQMVIDSKYRSLSAMTLDYLTSEEESEITEPAALKEINLGSGSAMKEIKQEPNEKVCDYHAQVSGYKVSVLFLFKQITSWLSPRILLVRQSLLLCKFLSVMQIFNLFWTKL